MMPIINPWKVDENRGADLGGQDSPFLGPKTS